MSSTNPKDKNKPSKKIDIDTKNLFDDFFFNVFLGKLKHPENPKRTFYYGDCLEPIIEKILDVNF